MIERDRFLKYKSGYKYQVHEDYHIKLDIVPYAPIFHKYFTMDMTGKTVIFSSYAWDGASGPTIDTKSSMISSLVHDLIYQLIRLGLVDPNYREYADGILRDISIEDGMWKWRASMWYWAVKNFAKQFAVPGIDREILTAP